MKPGLLILVLLLGLGALLPGCAGSPRQPRTPQVVDGTEAGIDLVEATRSLKAQLKVAPEDPQTLLALGNVFARRGLYSEAIATFRTLTRVDDQHAVGWHNLALCYERQGLIREARAAAETAATLAPGNQMFVQEVQRVTALQRDGESGQRAFTEKVSQAYHALNRFDADGLKYAASLVEDLMRVWPEQSETWNAAGLVAVRQGDVVTGATRFDTAIERNPKALQARYNRALLAWQAGESALARRHLSALRNLLPVDDDRGRLYVDQLLGDLDAGKSPTDARFAAREFPVR